jgi:hypothetical protein
VYVQEEQEQLSEHTDGDGSSKVFVVVRIMHIHRYGWEGVCCSVVTCWRDLFWIELKRSSQSQQAQAPALTSSHC